MAEVFIPTIGTRLRVKQNWTFQLFPEYRNASLFGALGIPFNLSWGHGRDDWGEPTVVTIVAGSLLTVSRIYIRGSFRDFDSMTFSLTETPDPQVVKGRRALEPDGTPSYWDKGNRGVRFWCKLDEVNGLDCEVEAKPVPVKRTPKVKP